MRRFQKKQAEDFVELLGQAHEEIKKSIEQKNTQAALSLLADCQEGAIALGELIEKAEGEDAGAVRLLEEYCERVYRIHGELSSYSVNADKAYKMLRQSLLKIKNSVKNEIKTRLEVVFLPYKAAMWDSLESIWKAADEDPECDAYVIPIPYYDKNPDESFGEIHYELNQYPEYVPVIRYEDYDFEKRHPDVIFIHNPYDKCNYVTSVEPFFYSLNLKKFTDKLVYVPYFILGEADPEKEEDLDEISHFCTVPGVVNADLIIVQSENMREIYIKIMTKFMAGQQGFGQKYWEEKILGLGSPKIDRVLTTKKKDLELPDEWLKVILKPDGSRKRIIFYNTCVTALLKHSEKYLVKMQDTFRIFYENREEIALLWRPHPLMQATLSSLRQRLLEEYMEMVTRYREEGWGIYDDTADVDRAVELSDGYFGDWSSVVQLYQETGKPVMIQDVEIIMGQENDAG